MRLGFKKNCARLLYFGASPGSHREDDISPLLDLAQKIRDIYELYNGLSVDTLGERISNANNLLERKNVCDTLRQLSQIHELKPLLTLAQLACLGFHDLSRFQSTSTEDSDDDLTQVSHSVPVEISVTATTETEVESIGESKISDEVIFSPNHLNLRFESGDISSLWNSLIQQLVVFASQEVFKNKGHPYRTLEDGHYKQYLTACDEAIDNITKDGHPIPSHEELLPRYLQVLAKFGTEFEDQTRKIINDSFPKLAQYYLEVYMLEVTNHIEMLKDRMLGLPLWVFETLRFGPSNDDVPSSPYCISPSLSTSPDHAAVGTPNPSAPIEIIIPTDDGDLEDISNLPREGIKTLLNSSSALPDDAFASASASANSRLEIADISNFEERVEIPNDREEEGPPAPAPPPPPPLVGFDNPSAVNEVLNSGEQKVKLLSWSEEKEAVVPTASIPPADDSLKQKVPKKILSEKRLIQVTPVGAHHSLPLKISPNQRISDFVEAIAPTEAKGSLTLVNSNGDYVDPTAPFFSCSENSFELQRVTGLWRNEQRVTLRPELCDEMRDRFQILRESTIKILEANPPTLPSSTSQQTLSFGTLCHCLSGMLSSKNKEVLLFDSKDPNPFFQTIIDQGHQIGRLDEGDVDIVSFRFEDLSPIGSQTSLQEYLLTSSPEDVKAKFVKYFCEELKMSIEKVSEIEVIAGSVIVNMNAKSWTLDDRNNFIALGSKIPATSITIHPLFKSCTIDIAIFDKRGDKTDFHGANFSLGPRNQKQTYYQPLGGQGWTRFGLDVLGKYADGDGWLKPFSSEQNWWRAYHGTSQSGVEGIVKDGTKDGMFRESLGGKLQKGVYVTPHLEYAACYSQTCEFGDGKYILVLQCAVKPGQISAQGYKGSNSFAEYPGLAKIFQERYKDQNSEWTFPSHCVRPYGILVGDVEKLEEIYGKGAIGNRKRGGVPAAASATTGGSSPRSQSSGSGNQRTTTTMNTRAPAQPQARQSKYPSATARRTNQASPQSSQSPQQACCRLS